MQRTSVSFVVVVFALALCAAAEDHPSLTNFSYLSDGSEALFTTGDIPQVVGERLRKSVGIAFLAKRAYCPAADSCVYSPVYSPVFSGTAFVVGDHRVVTAFHLFEGEVMVSPTGKIQRLGPKGPERFLSLILFFDGKLYEGDLMNRDRIIVSGNEKGKGEDLALIRVHDPDGTFNAQPIPLAENRLQPGLKKLYTLGFYDGCVHDSDPKAKQENKNDFCLTPGLLTFRVFRGYSQKISGLHDVGVVVREITYGFSGSPMLDEDGECVGVDTNMYLGEFRTYFVPADTTRKFIEQAEHQPSRLVEAKR